MTPKVKSATVHYALRAPNVELLQAVIRRELNSYDCQVSIVLACSDGMKIDGIECAVASFKGGAHVFTLPDTLTIDEVLDAIKAKL